ncbi:hypothetical protein BDN72DRAFT_117520 [Pluteus cervinus]|uniref:Uncharacterized protein n=1 Tax=Pluteus cervinus TaxID=181527 RepID=A0ACD3B8K5_9AGAR|nr:hypothetical protein BDN72DRAFT_117520 [Pluteus cervinus]
MVVCGLDMVVCTLQYYYLCNTSSPGFLQLDSAVPGGTYSDKWNGEDLAEAVAGLPGPDFPFLLPPTKQDSCHDHCYILSSHNHHFLLIPLPHPESPAPHRPSHPPPARPPRHKWPRPRPCPHRPPPSQRDGIPALTTLLLIVSSHISSQYMVSTGPPQV